MKKIFLLFIFTFLSLFTADAQKRASVFFHEIGKTYQQNELVSLDGIIYRALSLTNDTPPSPNWQKNEFEFDSSELLLLIDNNTAKRSYPIGDESKVSNLPLDQSSINTTQNALINTKVNTTDLPELVQDLLDSSIIDGTNISTVYDDALGMLTINANIPTGLVQEDVEDIVGNLIVSGTGINSVYDDNTGLLTISLSGQEFTLTQASEISANTLKRSYPLADETKLLGIETEATADQTASEVPLVDAMDNWTSTNLEDLAEEISMRILGIPSTTIDDINFISTGVQNQYNISVEWTDGNGVTHTSSTNTPFTIDDANFVNLTTNQTIDGQKVFSMNIETTGVQITGGVNNNILLDGGDTIPIADLQLDGYREVGGDPSDDNFQVTIGDPNEDNTGFNLRVSPGSSEFIVGDIYGNEGRTLFKLNDADRRIQLGDPDGIAFGLGLDINGGIGQVRLGATGGGTNGTGIIIDDTFVGQSISMKASNGVFISDDLNIGFFGNRATISTNSTAPNIDLMLPSETGTIALVGDVETIDLTDNSDDTFTFTNSLGTTTTFDAKTSPFDNSDGSSATETSTEINFSGDIGLGIIAPAYQLDTSEDVQVNGVEIGRGSGNIDSNTRLGNNALLNNTTGIRNSAGGDQSLINNTIGSSITAFGFSSSGSNIDGGNNSSFGSFSNFRNESGDNNSSFGGVSSLNNVSGGNNSSFGFSSYRHGLTGSNNVNFGFESGSYFGGVITGTTRLFTSNNGVYIGAETFALTDNSVNEIVIGSNAIGNGSNTATIGDDQVMDTYLSGDVHADAYIINSDSRLKTNLVDTGLSKTINGNNMSIYSFDYTSNGNSQLGVLAQDVLLALNGLPQPAIDAIIMSKAGRDDNATLLALNNGLGGNATTLNEAYDMLSDAAVRLDLENNGFSTITIEDALAELEELESLVEEELTENQLDRLTRLRLVDFTGKKVCMSFDVLANDILSLNTTALQWVLN